MKKKQGKRMGFRNEEKTGYRQVKKQKRGKNWKNQQ